jgi:hypothetical protein
MTHDAKTLEPCTSMGIWTPDSAQARVTKPLKMVPAAEYLRNSRRDCIPTSYFARSASHRTICGIKWGNAPTADALGDGKFQLTLCLVPRAAAAISAGPVASFRSCVAEADQPGACGAGKVAREEKLRASSDRALLAEGICMVGSGHALKRGN